MMVLNLVRCYALDIESPEATAFTFGKYSSFCIYPFALKKEKFMELFY